MQVAPIQIEESKKYGFGLGATHNLIVCNLCHAELETGKTVPYKAKCPNGCGKAKTSYHFSLLFSKKPGVHRMVVISSTNKNYAIWQNTKEVA